MNSFKIILNPVSWCVAHLLTRHRIRRPPATRHEIIIHEHHDFFLASQHLWPIRIDLAVTYEIIFLIRSHHCWNLIHRICPRIQYAIKRNWTSLLETESCWTTLATDWYSKAFIDTSENKLLGLVGQPLSEMPRIFHTSCKPETLRWNFSAILAIKRTRSDDRHANNPSTILKENNPRVLRVNCLWAGKTFLGTLVDNLDVFTTIWLFLLCSQARIWSRKF